MLIVTAGFTAFVQVDVPGQRIGLAGGAEVAAQRVSAS
jgi:hypothetical protein